MAAKPLNSVPLAVKSLTIVGIAPLAEHLVAAQDVLRRDTISTRLDQAIILCYSSFVNVDHVIFDRHCSKHGLTPEDIVYAAEHLTSDLERCVIDGSIYLRFTGRHLDSLMPQIGVVLKVTPNRIIIVYHAAAAHDGFWSVPFLDWIRTNARNQGGYDD